MSTIGDRFSDETSLYRKLLFRTLFGHRTRSRPASEDGECLGFSSSSPCCRPKNPAHHVPDRMLDAPELVDDRNLNLLNWGSSGLLSIALGERVHFWNSAAAAAAVPEAIEVAEPVTSICWAPDGERIAIGLRNSEVQLWDVRYSTLLRTLRRGSPVGALAWKNECILTTGGGDGKVVNNDVRVSESQVVGTFQGHMKEVCSVKWSGRQLATGANDNIVHIWDLSMASNCSRNRWVHKFTDHKGGGIRALAWCPLQRNLLATGGGAADRCIKFWSTSTGSCLGSVDVGSEVCALLWNKREMELLSSCGDGQSPLTVSLVVHHK